MPPKKRPKRLVPLTKQPMKGAEEKQPQAVDPRLQQLQVMYSSDRSREQVHFDVYHLAVVTAMTDSALDIARHGFFRQKNVAPYALSTAVDTYLSGPMVRSLIALGMYAMLNKPLHQVRKTLPARKRHFAHSAYVRSFALPLIVWLSNLTLFTPDDAVTYLLLAGIVFGSYQWHIIHQREKALVHSHYQRLTKLDALVAPFAQAKWQLQVEQNNLRYGFFLEVLAFQQAKVLEMAVHMRECMKAVGLIKYYNKRSAIVYFDSAAINQHFVTRMQFAMLLLHKRLRQDQVYQDAHAKLCAIAKILYKGGYSHANMNDKVEHLGNEDIQFVVEKEEVTEAMRRGARLLKGALFSENIGLAFPAMRMPLGLRVSIPPKMRACFDLAVVQAIFPKGQHELTEDHWTVKVAEFADTAAFNAFLKHLDEVHQAELQNEFRHDFSYLQYAPAQHRF